MVWLVVLLLLLSLLLYAIRYRDTHRGKVTFFHQWFNGSYKDKNGKAEREILLVQQHFYYFEHGNFIIEGRLFLFKIKKKSNLFLCFCHSFRANQFVYFPFEMHAVRVCARYSLIGIKFEMWNIKWQEYGFEFALRLSFTRFVFSVRSVFWGMLIAIYIGAPFFYEF